MGDALEIRVRDDGDGIDPVVLEGSAAGARGLGLAGARQRLRFHGGDLHVHSVPGGGTRITVKVPVAQV